MEDIILCTKNKGKVKEFKELFEGFKLDINLISLDDLNDNDEVIEDGNSFSQNAYIKAHYYYEKHQKCVIADDSGLCIDYLGGMPGINSARYSGMGPKENIKKVLGLMKEVINRSAHFTCVLCFIDEKGKVDYFEGRVDGSIAYTETGDNGFGYDPIFIVNHNGKNISMASLSEGEKNKISHRYQAILSFASWYKAK